MEINAVAGMQQKSMLRCRAGCACQIDRDPT